MSSLYNTCSLQPSTRVGNWVEEDALRAATGTIRNDVSVLLCLLGVNLQSRATLQSWVEDRVERRDRVKLADTGSRVVYHSENLVGGDQCNLLARFVTTVVQSPKEYMTETQAAQDPSFGKRSFQVSTGLPPRAARETQRFTLAARYSRFSLLVAAVPNTCSISQPTCVRTTQGSLSVVDHKVHICCTSSFCL